VPLTQARKIGDHFRAACNVHAWHSRPPLAAGALNDGCRDCSGRRS
jgi:hypothetical protein